jgi:hypothetical protein
MKKIIFGLVLLIMTVTGAFAQNRKEIDIRTRSELGNPYYVIFHSYPAGTRTLDGGSSTAGHTYVQFRGETSNQSQNFIRGMLRSEGGVTGVRQEDLRYADISTRRLIVRVNKSQWDDALAVTMGNFYFLAVNDCVTYAARVARALRLNVSGVLYADLFPDNFLRGLILDN